MGQFVEGVSFDIVVILIFVICWLIFWLKCFQDWYLIIIVYIVEWMELFFLVGSGFDVVIYFVYLVWVGMYLYLLLEEVLVFVCSLLFFEDVGVNLLLDVFLYFYWWQNLDVWQIYVQEVGIVLINLVVGL